MGVGREAQGTRLALWLRLRQLLSFRVAEVAHDVMFLGAGLEHRFLASFSFETNSVGGLFTFSPDVYPQIRDFGTRTSHTASQGFCLRCAPIAF